MPSDRFGEELGFLCEFLGVVFAEVEVGVLAAAAAGVQGEDVVCGL